MVKRRRIWVSKLNPRMSVKSLNEFGFSGKTPSSVLKKVKKHYPKAKLVNG